MLAPGGEVSVPSPLGRMMLSSLRRYPDYVGELQRESGLPIDFRQVGAVEVAFTDEEAEDLEIRAASQASLGIPSEPSSYNGFHARYYPEDSLVDPRQVVAALVKVLRQKGIKIHERNGAVSLWPDGSGFATARRDVRCDDGLLVAAGAWSGEFHRSAPSTIPVKGHLASWNLEPGKLGPILRNGHTYVMQRANGVVVAGSNEERVGYFRRVRKGAIQDIRARAARLLPELGEREPDSMWTGFRPGIDADQPFIGRIPGTAAHGAFGHYRNGILLAPETGVRFVDFLAAHQTNGL